jgi:hypothetical protein
MPVKPSVLIPLALLAVPTATLAKPAAPAQIPYTVSAPEDAVYDLRCKFRAVRIQNAMVNSANLSGKGAKKGLLPSDNARCLLKQTAGKGPVTLTIVKGKANAVTVAGPGKEQMLAVF